MSTVARDGAPAPGRERPQALAEEHVVHPQGRCRVRRPHGGRARPLCRSPRSEAAGGVLRRKPDPADRRSAPADPGRTGPAGALRLRVQRNGTANLFVFLDAHRPWRNVKVTERRTTATSPTACASSADIHYPRRRAHPRRARQSVHPRRRRALPGPAGGARRGASSGGWSSTSRPSTPAGSTWSRSRSASCAASASTAASKAATASSPRSPLGKTDETKAAHASTGCSQPNRRASKWTKPAFGHRLPTSSAQ